MLFWLASDSSQPLAGTWVFEEFRLVESSVPVVILHAGANGSGSKCLLAQTLLKQKTQYSTAPLMQSLSPPSYNYRLPGSCQANRIKKPAHLCRWLKKCRGLASHGSFIGHEPVAGMTNDSKSLPS